MALVNETEIDQMRRNISDAEKTIARLEKQLAERTNIVTKLQTNEDRYRSILESTNAVAWELDVKTLKFTYVSPQIEALSGYPPEAWTDFEFWASKIHSDEREDAVNWCQVETAKGLDHEIEYRMMRADGHTVWVRDAISVISEEKNPVLLRGHFFDINDRKLSEEASFAMQATTFRSQKLESLGVMASGIAHDFNNLLSVMLGNTELCLAMSNENAPITALLEDVNKAGNQAAELIREMLTYVGKDPLKLKDTDLNTLILDMWSLVERAHPKTVNLTHDLTRKLPLAMADSTLIQQVLLNLILNASDAVGANNGSILVRTKLVDTNRIELDEIFTNPLPTSDQCILIEVSDTGSGIDEAVAENLFEPFFSTKRTGRGLGLATVQRIVDRHNGTISVKSKLGQGTTFGIYFPVLEQRCVTQAENQIQSDEGHQSKGKILVVDDEEGVRGMASKVLEYFGFSVLCASNGFAALDIFKESYEDIDCVLLDLRMPLMSGEETLDALREIDENVNVVLASGNYDPDDAARLNVSTFIQKPYSMEAIKTALSDAIRKPISS
ncbi:MAG: ATP-binding protein [Aliishimia sp.]